MCNAGEGEEGADGGVRAQGGEATMRLFLKLVLWVFYFYPSQGGESARDSRQ